MKAELRAEARSRLARLTPAARERAGRAVSRRVWQLEEIAGAGRLLVYASLPAELPTDAIAAQAERRGITLVYPRCLPDSREMSLHRLGAGGALIPGLHGIPEPDAGCPVVALEDIDAALVPGLAWDRRGARLGRGAGYYDRLLGDPRWRGFVCGLFFAAQELGSIPSDAWDVAMHAVVTEKEVVRFEPRDSGWTAGGRCEA